MKKVSRVIEEKNVYDIKILIRDTALIESVTGKTGLINIKTNEIVGSFDKFYTIYNFDDNFYFQEKEVEDESKEYSKRKKYVRIYDTLYEKMVVDCWLVVNQIGYYNLAILQNPITKKYHLFHEVKYRTSLNIFETGYDDIEHLYNYNNEEYLVLTKDKKKAIYSAKKGFTTPFEFDDIERTSKVTIFTQGKYKFFTCVKDYEENEIKSPLFEEISIDKNNDNLLYCKRNNMIAIYYIEQYRCRLLFTALVCDDIKCVKSIDDFNNSGYSNLSSEYIFLVEKNNKYGLLSGVVDKDEENEVSCQSLVDIEYDEIKYKDGDFFLNKDGKQGIFAGNAKNNYLIKEKYDKVIPIYDSYFYELYNGESCNIVLFNSIEQPIISDVRIVKNIGKAVIYEKNGRKGIFWALDDNEHLILEAYDDVEYLKYNYFLVTKNEKKGIMYGTETIIEPKYESIEINGYHEYKNLDFLYYAKTLYFALKVADGQYELAKYKIGQYREDKNELKYLNGQGLSDIKLYDDIMVFKDQNNAYVYSYDEKLLKTYPVTVDVSKTTVTRGKDKIDLYLVDGVYYIYRNQRFEEAPVEDCKLYVTVYESEYGIVVVNSYNKQEYDKKVKQIEEDGEETLDKTLKSIYEKKPEIQEKYPTLMKKLN